MVKAKKATKSLEPVTRDYTINLHRLCHSVAFKKKAPRAIKAIVKFTQQQVLTEDVRIDTALNQYVWSKGIRNLPRRVRVRISRKKNEDAEGKGKFYALVQHIPVDSFKGLQTQRNTGK